MLGNNASRAGWVQNNFITVDTQKIAANAQSELAAAVSELAVMRAASSTSSSRGGHA